MPNSNYLTEEEKKKRQQQQQAQMSPNNPAMALNGNYMRQSASDVVNSWATPTPTTGATGTTPEAKKPTLSEQAINNYTNKVQSLYDYEAQQRASADANFQKSMRYLPQMFKQAGLYGSGQSESTLADMANEQRNTLNDISAKTNKDIMDLKDDYNTDVENLDEQTKLQVDEVANYISNVDFTNYSVEDFNNFKDYILSAGYSEDVWNKAVKQIQAFKPEVGHQINQYTNILSGTDTNYSQDDVNQTKQLSVSLPSYKKAVRYADGITVNFNGKTYNLNAREVVTQDMDEELDKFAKMSGKENKAGDIVYYKGEIYVQSGQDKGWRKVGEGSVGWNNLKNLKNALKNQN